MKYCCSCGAALPDTAAFCSACGKAVDPPVVRPTAPAAPAADAPSAPPAPPVAPAADAWVTPLAPSETPEIVYETPVVPAATRRPVPQGANVFAIVSFVAGILGVTLFFFVTVSLEDFAGFLVSLLWVGNGVLGIIFSCKARGTRLRGLARAGKILSIVGLAIAGIALLGTGLSLLESGDLPGDLSDLFNT